MPKKSMPEWMAKRLTQLDELIESCQYILTDEDFELLEQAKEYDDAD